MVKFGAKKLITNVIYANFGSLNEGFTRNRKAEFIIILSFLNQPYMKMKQCFRFLKRLFRI